MLAFTLGAMEISVIVVVGLGAVLLLKRLRRPESTDVRRACPECREINLVERRHLGTRVRCAACGSLLYPNEQPPSTNVHVHNNVAAKVEAAPSATSTEPAVRIIERQVVVERCGHCGQVSPVEQLTCPHCGAPKHERPSTGAR